MEIIAQIIGIAWCTLCIGTASWYFIEYFRVKNKKL